MIQFKIAFAFILLLTISFVSVFADTTSKSQSDVFLTKSVLEQSLQQLSSLLHFKSGYVPLEFDKKQIVEYSIIAAIALIVIIVIASSVRTKNSKPIRK